MQSNSQKGSIVFASVLNAINDTRMFEMMATTLADNGYQVFVLGQSSESIPAHANIEFIAFKRVPRVSLQRFLMPWKIALKVYQLKPEVLIVNTHELLIVSIINRILFGCKILYDVRENYYRNILFSEAFSPLVRWLLASIVRLKEKLTSPLFHHFILAEKCYQEELGFVGNRYTLLENKATVRDNFKRAPDTPKFDLIFTGTIAASTGIFETIALAESLHQINTKVRLTIIGYCALPAIRRRLIQTVKDKPFVTLIGIDQLVPHRQIMIEIVKASFGIIYYPPSPHTAGSMPTKLYEYMACQLPILTWENQYFAKYVLSRHAGLVVPPNTQELHDAMQRGSFYPEPLTDIYWQGEVFQNLIDTVSKSHSR